MNSIMILALFLLIFNTSRDKLTINCEIAFQADMVCPIKYDKDNCDEFLIRKDFRYYITNQKQITYFQINMPGENSIFLKCIDIDNQPPGEFVFQCKKDDGLWLYVYSGTKFIKKFKTLKADDIQKADGWDGWFSDLQMMDINNDGNNDLILTVNSGFDLQPRGIFVYDMKDTCELWHYWIGGSPHRLNLVDVDGDGEKEIITTTTAVANGSEANGFDDCKSYVYVFNKNGVLLWYREVGGVFSDALCWVGDIDGDDKIEIIITECEGTADKDIPNRILILNAQDGTTEKYIQSGDKYMGMVICDINRDEKYEIITGNTDGIIRIYSSDLTCLFQKDFGTRIKVLAARDLNNDGTDEIVARIPEERILFLDENLENIGECISKKGGKIELNCINNGRKTKLLLVEGNQAPFLYSLLSFSDISVIKKITENQPPFFIISTIILLLIIVAMLFYYKKTVKKLNKKEDYTNQILEWSGFAQRLAHEIKNPLSTINLTLQRMQQVYKEKFGKKAGQLDRYAKSVLEEVERLRDTTDKFMRILSIGKPQFAKCPLQDIIDELLQRYEKNLPGGVSFKRCFAKDLPLVRCDAAQVSTAFSNIIENALEAMGSKGVLTVRLTVVEKIIDKSIKRYVEIKFEDTGRGMSDRELQNLFKPFESNKPGGTGLGLVIARAIIEQHQGQIKVESEKGIGTVVTVLLPI